MRVDNRPARTRLAGLGSWKYRAFAACWGFALWCVAATSPALAINLNLPEHADAPVKQTKVIPYAFFNASTGAAAAAAVVATGLLQPQTTTVANGFVSANDSQNLFVAMMDLRVPGSERFFVDTQFMYGNWGETDSYQDGNPGFPLGGAGGNDSHGDNFIEVDGDDLHYRVKLRYLLPLGHGAGEPIHTFRTRNGLLVPGTEAGGKGFNPFRSGRTTLELEWFYRDQSFEDEFDTNFDNITSGLKFIAEYDNTDWYAHPSTGNRTRVSFARDWGLEAESNTWSAVQLQFSSFFSLPHDANVRQRVLALDFWMSDVPTWNSSSTRNGQETFHRAPLFEGSTLGGLDRQRGFFQNRFHDRSAVNYAAEFRQMPVSNPFTRIPLIKRLNIPWWEWIVFAEVGRVAEKPAFSTLHKDMKVSAGAGVRMLVEGLVIRLDVAGSEEGGEVQMFFGHTF